MTTVWVLDEVTSAGPSSASGELLTAARGVADTVGVVALGPGAVEAADAYGRFGAATVFVCDDDEVAGSTTGGSRAGRAARARTRPRSPAAPDLVRRSRPRGPPAGAPGVDAHGQRDGPARSRPRTHGDLRRFAGRRCRAPRARARTRAPQAPLAGGGGGAPVSTHGGRGRGGGPARPARGTGAGAPRTGRERPLARRREGGRRGRTRPRRTRRVRDAGRARGHDRRCGGGSLARGRGCRLGAVQLPDRSDRQDREARGLPRDRDQRGAAARGRDEGVRARSSR